MKNGITQKKINHKDDKIFQIFFVRSKDDKKLKFSFIKDFTKQYNRLRQKLQTGTSSGSITHQKAPKGNASSAVRGVSIESKKKSIETTLQDQMKSLSKYANRIHIGM